MNMEYLLGLTVLNMKEIGFMENNMEKDFFINGKGIEQEGIWENGKLHEFFIMAMQNSKSKFLHGSNGLPNKANEYSSRRLLSSPNSGKTAC